MVLLGTLLGRSQGKLELFIGGYLGAFKIGGLRAVFKEKNKGFKRRKTRGWKRGPNFKERGVSLKRGGGASLTISGERV